MSQEEKDPYPIWLSEVMLQQTTVATVKAYFKTFTEIWPTVVDLASASQDDVLSRWAGLGYYARARNLHKCAQAIVQDHGGRFPQTEAELLTLPGVGAYTAAAIASIAFDRRAIVVDGNVERVVSRLFAVEEQLPKAKTLLKRYADTLTPHARCGDYAQAMMDLGATVCTPKSPACLMCPVRSHCKSAEAGIPERYPRKTPKAPKPIRYGVVYVIQRKQDHAFVLERRPDKGLLGGMLGFPTTAWSTDDSTHTAPFASDWTTLNTPVVHVFTHFELRLMVQRTMVEELTNLPSPFKDMTFYAIDALASLPTLMKKVAKVGLL